MEETKTRECSKCGKVLPLTKEHFYTKHHATGCVFRRTCKSCNRNRAGTKTCRRCQVVRPNTEEFYPLKANGRSALCCTACETDYQEYKRYYSREHQAMTYARNRAYVDKIKTSAGCADCGYNAHAIALDFDHLPGHTKYKNVSKMSINGSSIRALDREIAKCEVVCANCHRVRTAGRYT